MKFYLSYWSDASRQLKNNDSNLTIEKDIEKKIILTDLAVRHLRKHYKEIHLITDYNGARIFKNIGFTSIDKSLENVPKRYSETWSLGKLYAFKTISEKGDPFLHIDYDVFLSKPINPEFLKIKEIIVQSIELNLNVFGYNVDYFYKNCPIRNYAQDIKVDYAYNCGVFGGSNLEFINKYATSSIDMVMKKENIDFWIKNQTKKNPDFKDFSKAILAEQYYLAVCLKYFNVNPGLIVCSDLESRYRKGTYWPFDPFVKEHIGYLHVFGSFKDKWFSDYYAGKLKFDV